MEIITDYKRKKEWNDFVVENSYPASFLQSWEWGDFNHKILANQIQRWAVVDAGELKMIFTFIKKDLPFGRSYYYCPRGLIWKKDYRDQRTTSYPKVLERLRQELKSAVFMRTCPPSLYQGYIYGFLKRLGFKKPQILTHSKEPGKTLILDLAESENELLSQMHHKTRYNIRLAGKKGVKVRELTPKTEQTDIDIFFKLSKETAKRDNIQIYSKDYYAQLIKYFIDNDLDIKLKLYIAEFNNEPLSAMIVIYFGQTATYLHGASSGEHRNLMPNYLIQWQAIKDAKNFAMQTYDFWGISEQNKAWAGITRFKKGFGGRIITFMGAWDYVLNKRWYNLFRVLKLIKKLSPFL